MSFGNGEDPSDPCPFSPCWSWFGRRPIVWWRRKIPSKSFSEDIVQEIISFPRQALHAASLGFVHPKSKETYVLKPLA